MTEADQSDVAEAMLARQPLQAVLDAVANPEEWSGGGAVAALTLAGAAASAELVVAVARRRKANAARRGEIDEYLSQLRALRPRLLAAADRDLAALSNLMSAQQERRRTRDSEESAEHLRQAYLAAAAVPIETAATGLELLRVVHRALPFGSRFTISDLGAAGALTSGAIEATLLTAEANLGYLTGPDAARLIEQIAELRRETAGVGQEIVQITHQALTGSQEDTPRGTGA